MGLYFGRSDWLTVNKNENIKIRQWRLLKWGATIIGWVDQKSSFIIAMAAIVALLIYDGQRRIMENTLAVMQKQQTTTDSTLQLMKMQTDVLTEESIRRFRPFPVVNVQSAGHAVLTYGVRQNDNSIKVVDVSLVSHGSRAWEQREAVALAVDNVELEIKNIGNSPLYVTSRDFGGIVFSEWSDEYGKSEAEVCRAALSKQTFWHPDIDLLVMPGDSIGFPPNLAKAIRTMDITTFDAYLDEDSAGLPFYVYFYLQYEDLYGRSYDAIWMATYIFDFSRVKNDSGEFIDKASLGPPFREKMRWDILCPVR